ncbi:unnamed protein product, partial [Ectocarpus sp. 12 AP-2014]
VSFHRRRQWPRSRQPSEDKKKLSSAKGQGGPFRQQRMDIRTTGGSSAPLALC